MKKCLLLFTLLFISCVNNQREYYVEYFPPCKDVLNKRKGVCISFQTRYYKNIAYPSILKNSEVDYFNDYFKKDYGDSLYYRLIKIHAGNSECFSENNKDCNLLLFFVGEIQPLKIDSLNVFQLNAIKYYVRIKDGLIENKEWGGLIAIMKEYGVSF